LRTRIRGLGWFFIFILSFVSGYKIDKFINKVVTIISMKTTLDQISFVEWHPKISDKLWERLARGTRWAKFTENGLDAKCHWNTNAAELISYRVALEHFLHQYRVAFAVEHFLTEQGLDKPKILEVGSWPAKNYTVGAQFGTTLIAILSQNEDYIVAGVDSMDTKRAFPWTSWTPPNFGSGRMFYGNIHDEETRAEITSYLGSEPQIIVGNMMFERRLGAHMAGAKWEGSTERYSHVAEDLSETCNSYLASHGVLVVCNRGYGEIPNFVKGMPLICTYQDEKGRELVQIRAKVTE